MIENVNARAGSHPAKAAGRAGDDDDVLYGLSLLRLVLARQRMSFLATSDEAAVGAEDLAVDPPAIPAGEEGNGVGDVLRQAERSTGGVLAKRSISSWDLPFRKRSVAVGPRATALTVMLRPRSSLARIAVNISTPALVAA